MAKSSIQQNYVDCYVYAIVVDGIIRYVGRSNRPLGRLTQHRCDSRHRCRGLFLRKLAKAIRTGSTIDQIILAGPFNRSDAAKVEIIEIAARGGHTIRGRQLWNTHRGGLGGSSEQASAALRAKWANDSVFRAKVSDAAREQIKKQRADDPTFEQARLSGSRRFASTAEGQQRLVNARSHIDRSKQRSAVSAAMKAIWADPEIRKQKTAFAADSANRLWSDLEYRNKVTNSMRTVEAKAQRSASATRLWADPEFRKRAIAGMREARANGAGVRKKHLDRL